MPPKLTLPRRGDTLPPLPSVGCPDTWHWQEPPRHLLKPLERWRWMSGGRQLSPDAARQRRQLHAAAGVGWQTLAATSALDTLEASRRDVSLGGGLRSLG